LYKTQARIYQLSWRFSPSASLFDVYTKIITNPVKKKAKQQPIAIDKLALQPADFYFPVTNPKWNWIIIDFFFY